MIFRNEKSSHAANACAERSRQGEAKVAQRRAEAVPAKLRTRLVATR
jgi:hypothetical protein